ncbi:hypothetical protein Micbo1qcDRAFT_19764 [Microdochium bolleyi]|uniref:Uncharacterized protein n=1 Tax=Microdochium bolleyi TaxID=196109 RepID=A0A136ITV2_9PEZI|nr:hypothetical protein Micbo1qcDRAFT_19764 [Microdochium bolleyi]
MRHSGIAPSQIAPAPARHRSALGGRPKLLPGGRPKNISSLLHAGERESCRCLTRRCCTPSLLSYCLTLRRASPPPCQTNIAPTRSFDTAALPLS